MGLEIILCSIVNNEIVQKLRNISAFDHDFDCSASSSSGCLKSVQSLLQAESVSDQRLDIDLEQNNNIVFYANCCPHPAHLTFQGTRLIFDSVPDNSSSQTVLSFTPCSSFCEAPSLC